MNYVCEDNRFEIIERYKNELISATNIEGSPEEMAVLDNILFRFWQMGWLKEQKAVEPKQVDLYGNDEWWGLVCVCPDCNAEWMTDKANTHYCPNCGIRVKLE